MKTLVVYYSLEGNTEYAANRIAENLGADTLRLVPVKAYPDKGFMKFFVGGRSAVFGQKPALEHYETDLSAYDRIIFGFPVWAANFAPPIHTFISENADEIRGKKIAAFACQGGSGAQKAFLKLRKLISPASFEALGIFIEPGRRQAEETDKAIDRFCEKLS